MIPHFLTTETLKRIRV